MAFQLPKAQTPEAVPAIVWACPTHLHLTSFSVPSAAPPRSNTIATFFLVSFLSLIHYTLVSLCRRQAGSLSFFSAIPLLGIRAGRVLVIDCKVTAQTTHYLEVVLKQREKERWSSTALYHVTMR